MRRLFDKLFNKKKYYNDKYSLKTQKDKLNFKNNFENQINKIQSTLVSKKEISFLHSGHIGDIINILPILKEISKKSKCNLFIKTNTPNNVDYNDHPAEGFLLNEKIYKMLFPLLKKQEYINEIEIFSNQSIDINFDLIRDLPINLLFDNSRYGFHISGVQVDLNERFLEVGEHESIKNRIVILRSLRYQNPFISYKFLEKYKPALFIGLPEEYESLKKELNNLEFYDCKDFLEMASIIKSSKVLIGNSSIGIDIAEGLKSPRLLEASPYFPARQIHGKNGYDFYFQAHFEKYFDYLLEH